MRTIVLFTVIFGSVLVCSCQSIKPYQKELLLNPTMDDKGIATVASPFAASALVGRDFLASGSPSGSASSSCPTCGG